MSSVHSVYIQSMHKHQPTSPPVQFFKVQKVTFLPSPVKKAVIKSSRPPYIRLSVCVFTAVHILQAGPGPV